MSDYRLFALQLVTLFALLKIYWTVKAAFAPIFEAQEKLMMVSQALHSLDADLPAFGDPVESFKAYMAKLRERARGPTQLELDEKNARLEEYAENVALDHLASIEKDGIPKRVAEALPKQIDWLRKLREVSHEIRERRKVRETPPNEL